MTKELLNQTLRIRPTWGLIVEHASYPFIEEFGVFLTEEEANRVLEKEKKENQSVVKGFSLFDEETQSILKEPETFYFTLEEAEAALNKIHHEKA